MGDKSMIGSFFRKMKGTTQSPPRVSISEILWSWVGAGLGIGLVGYLNSRYFEKSDLVLIIGSFGASAVLIYGAIKSPLAQPRNLLGGHLLSALIGVLAFKWLGSQLWLASSLAVATSIALMHLTKTLHPPGGATALIAVIGGPKITQLGFLYALIPVGVGVAIMLLVALVVNNIPKQRRYPEFWF
jgi:CBS-domain-containing membrane protein